jgi:hypothetical protein
MSDPEACENEIDRGLRRSAEETEGSASPKGGDGAISVLLFFPSAYLLHLYWESPFAFLWLIGVWFLINVFFRLVPPGFAAIGAGLGTGAAYGASSYLLGANILWATLIGAIAYAPGYLSGVLAAQALHGRQH